MRTQFPPRGPRSNHIKLNVSTEERRQAETVAQLLGCTVVEAYKSAMRRTHTQLADHVPAVVREAAPEVYDPTPEVYDPTGGPYTMTRGQGVP